VTIDKEYGDVPFSQTEDGCVQDLFQIQVVHHIICRAIDFTKTIVTEKEVDKCNTV
jgi:hypothetical protein